MAASLRDGKQWEVASVSFPKMHGDLKIIKTNLWRVMITYSVNGYDIKNYGTLRSLVLGRSQSRRRKIEFQTENNRN